MDKKFINSDTIKCEVCDGQIRSSDMKKHLYYAHKIGTPPHGNEEIKCNKCGMIFHDFFSLQDHRKLKHNESISKKKSSKKKSNKKTKLSPEKLLKIKWSKVLKGCGGSSGGVSKVYGGKGMGSGFGMQGGAPGLGKKK